MPAREKEERSDSGEDNRIGQQESQEWVLKNVCHIFHLSPFTLRDSSQSPLIFFFSNVFQVERIVNCFYFYLRLQGLRNQLDCIFSTLGWQKSRRILSNLTTELLEEKQSNITDLHNYKWDFHSLCIRTVSKKRSTERIETAFFNTWSRSGLICTFIV